MCDDLAGSRTRSKSRVWIATHTNLPKKSAAVAAQCCSSSCFLTSHHHHHQVSSVSSLSQPGGSGKSFFIICCCFAFSSLTHFVLLYNDGTVLVVVSALATRALRTKSAKDFFFYNTFFLYVWEIMRENAKEKWLVHFLFSSFSFSERNPFFRVWLFRGVTKCSSHQ